MLKEVLVVAGLATFEIYAAIPTGFFFKLPAWEIALASTTGGIVGAFATTFLGEKVKKWLAKYRKPKPPRPENEKPGLGQRIWKKYGVIGLGLLGTFLIGAPLSITAGVGFNVPLRPLLLWCCIGVVLRSFIYTYIGHFTLHLL